MRLVTSSSRPPHDVRKSRHADEGSERVFLVADILTSGSGKLRASYRTPASRPEPIGDQLDHAESSTARRCSSSANVEESRSTTTGHFPPSHALMSRVEEWGSGDEE